MPGEGGAIWSDGTLTVTDSTFSGNRATGGAGVTTGVGGGDGDGGAIFNEGAVTVTNSTFSANQATGGVGDGAAGGDAAGGAILNQVGTATVINSTFSANLAIGGAGSDGGRRRRRRNLFRRHADCYQRYVFGQSGHRRQRRPMARRPAAPSTTEVYRSCQRKHLVDQHSHQLRR